MTNSYTPDEIRVFVGTDRSQQVGFDVLKYTIEKHTNRPVSVVPMLDLDLPEPKDKRQAKRTGFSFSRYAIPKLAGNQGRAIYMDADMQVFTDIGELWDVPFNGKKILIQEELPEQHVNVKQSIKPRKRVKQTAVSVLDCKGLGWVAEDIIAGLDDKYNYNELMMDLCILDESEVGYVVPFKWNSLEHWDETTANIHYTDMNTQPWVSNQNPFGWVWVNELKGMITEGVITLEYIRQEVDLGYARPSLLVELELEEDLSAPSNKRTKMLNAIDKDAGFIMHEEVYKNKKARLRAEKQYIAALGDKVKRDIGVKEIIKFILKRIGLVKK